MGTSLGRPFAKSSYGEQIPIGMSTYLTDRGAFFTAPDGTEWLRQGSAIPYSSKYSTAARYPELRTYASSPINAGTGTAAAIEWASRGHGVATDNNGTIIVPTGTAGSGSSNAQFYRSTDGGLTWGTVNATVSSSHYINSIVYVPGSRFVAAAATSSVSATSYYHSTDGSSWTAGSTFSGLLYKPGVCLDIDPSTGTVVAFSGYATGPNAVFRCTTGSTFAAPTTGVSANPTGTYQQNITINNNIVIAGGGGSTYYYSSDGGVNFSSVSVSGGPTGFATPSTAGCFACINNVYMLFTGDNSSTYFATETPSSGTSWKAYSTGVALYSSSYNNVTTVRPFFNSNKTKLYIPTYDGFIYTRDGYTWNRSFVYDLSRRNISSNYYYFPVITGKSLCFISSRSTSPYNLEVHVSNSEGYPEYIGYLPPSDTYMFEYIRVY